MIRGFKNKMSPNNLKCIDFNSTLAAYTRASQRVKIHSRKVLNQIILKTEKYLNEFN